MRYVSSVFACVLVLVAATAAHAASAASGTVDSMESPKLTVSGQRYLIGSDTELLDRGGRRITPKELVPGTPVDLEIGDDGDLVSVKAKLVR